MSWQVYTLLVPVPHDPERPERFELEVSDDLKPVLTYSQDGFPDSPSEQIFVSLDTLVRLGRMAQGIIDGTEEPERESVGRED